MNGGKLKAYYQRVITYITAINFFMIFYNFQSENKWFPWYVWVVIFCVVIYVVHFVDTHYIWEDEQRVTAEKNPVLMENNLMLKRLLDEQE